MLTWKGMIFLQSPTSKQEKGIVRLLEISRLGVRWVINTSCVLYKVQCQVRKWVCVLPVILSEWNVLEVDVLTGSLALYGLIMAQKELVDSVSQQMR